MSTCYKCGDKLTTSDDILDILFWTECLTDDTVDLVVSTLSDLVEIYQEGYMLKQNVPDGIRVTIDRLVEDVRLMKSQYRQPRNMKYLERLCDEINSYKLTLIL